MFVISDDLHDETAGEFSSLDDAVGGVQQLATVSWDEGPNLAPCTSWRTCGRHYDIVEYDDSSLPWHEVRRYPAVQIDASGVKWADSFPPVGA